MNREVNEPMVNTDGKKLPIIYRNKQYIAAIAVSLGGFCAGSVLAWTSPASEYLMKHETPTNTTPISLSPPGFTISTSEEAIVGAMLTIGALVFAIPAGKFADLFGRKFTLLLLSLLFLVNWVIIGFAKNVMMLLLARIFAGMALGGSCVVGPMYIGEIAEPAIRGILGSIFSILFASGILYTNVIGTFTNWIGLTIGLSLIPVAFGISVLFLPDTPIYLMEAKNLKKAEQSLTFFRKDESIVSEELSLLKKKSLENSRTRTFIELFSHRSYRKPLIAGIGVLALQQLCGINVVVFYTVPIFKAAGNSLSASIGAIITNLVSVAVAILSVFVVEKRGRKYFLTLSSFSMMLGVVGLGLFFQLKAYNVNFPGLQLVPISSLVLFTAGFCIGLGPVPWILISELYSPEIRGIASGVVVVINWLAAFLVTFTYPILMQSIGSYWTFYLYGLLNLLGILFIWFLVPETRGSNYFDKM